MPRIKLKSLRRKEQDAAREGIRARKAGKGKKTNPYIQTSAEFLWWDLGWDGGVDDE